MSIEKDPNYIEGGVVAQSSIAHIEKTMWGSLEEAIKAKEDTISHFETSWGFTREDYHNDRNYSHTCGFLDALKKAYEEEDKESEDH